jgi:hypothetical protein
MGRTYKFHHTDDIYFLTFADYCRVDALQEGHKGGEKSR